MSLTFTNVEGEKITGATAAILFLLIMPINLLILSYLVMLLFGVLHSGVASFPAFGFWYSLCAVALFRVLGWQKGPITYGGVKS
jgi:hypothetical protein